MKVEEDGAGHIVVLFRLPQSATDADAAAFLAALDSSKASTPPLAVALGGPEIGDTGAVVVELIPGRYVLGCVRRGAGGHRHASTGEAKVVVVPDVPVTDDHATPPTATQDVQMVDFAYTGPDRWPAGLHMLRVANGGKQDHQLRLVQLPPGLSLSDWIGAEDPGDVGTPIAGVARMGPGTVAYLPVELPAATYVAYCLITDPASGREHALMGMVREIQVIDGLTD